MTDDPTQAEPNRRGHWTGLIWLALGALLIKSLAFDAVAEDAFVKANWALHRGTITESEVAFRGLEGGYELHFAFEVELPGGARTYRSSVGTSGKDYGSEVEGQFAVGQQVDVYIDPEDQDRFRRPQSQTGLRAIGWGLGGFLGLIGVSVLVGRRREIEDGDGLDPTD